MKSFPSLLDIPQTIDVVDVFRRSEYVLPIAESAVTVGAKALWLQDGDQRRWGRVSGKGRFAGGNERLHAPATPANAN